MHVRHVSMSHASYQRRRRARGSAMRMARTIEAEYPDLRVTVDMETVDGEDAYVWIEVSRGARTSGLSEYIDQVARSYGRRTGYWIVPRITSTNVESSPEFRLRPRLSDARPLVY
jgi:hypothetical protein